MAAKKAERGGEGEERHRGDDRSREKPLCRFRTQEVG